MTPPSRRLSLFTQFSVWFGSSQLGYYSMSRGLLAMCNLSISSEFSLCSSLSEGFSRTYPKQASHTLLASQYSPCIRLGTSVRTTYI